MKRDELLSGVDPVTRRAFVGRSAQLLGAAGLLGGAGLLSACGGDDSPKAAGGGAGSGEIISPKIASSTSFLPMFIHNLAGPVLYGKEVGLNVPKGNILEFQSHTVAIQTALAHKADVISGSIVGSMAAVSQGLPLKIFAATRNRDDNVLAGLGKAKTFDDIFTDGVRVASDSKGGTSSTELQAIINRLKGPDTVVDSLPGFTVLESSGQRQAALAAGQVDAAMMHIDQFWTVQKAKPDAKILARSVDGPVFPINAFAALSSWLDQNQPTAIALAKSVVAASKAFTADFEEYRTAVDQLVEEPPSKDVLRRLWEFATEHKIWPTDAHLTQDAFDRAAKLAVVAEVFIKPPSYAKAVDTRPMDGASA